MTDMAILTVAVGTLIADEPALDPSQVTPGPLSGLMLLLILFAPLVGLILWIRWMLRRNRNQPPTG